VVVSSPIDKSYIGERPNPTYFIFWGWMDLFQSDCRPENLRKKML
jgi:hypothetical protein